MILVGIKVFVDGGIRFLYLGTRGTLEVEVQVFREVPAHGEVAIPEKLLREREGQLLAFQTLEVALLKFVVVARHLRVKGNVLGQKVEAQRLRKVQPLRPAFQVLERLPAFIHRRVAVVKGTAPLILTLIDCSLARGIAVGVAVGEREVSRIVGHRMALGFQSPAHIREREVGITGLGDGYRLYTVALMAVGSTVEGFVKTHVGIERIVAGTRLLFRHRIIEGSAHLGFVGEELTQLERSGDRVFFLSVGRPLHHPFLQTTEAIADITAREVHHAEVGKLHVHGA